MLGNLLHTNITERIKSSVLPCRERFAIRGLLIAPTDAATFVIVSLFFALVALVACLIPALKVNPVNALAAE